jgi:hypothetical protein
MTAITRPYNWSALDDITAARMSQDYSAGLLGQDPPCAIVRRVATQSITNNTFSDVSFDTEVVDNDTLVDLVGQPTRVTIAHDGYYSIQFGVKWASNATGVRVQAVSINATVQDDMAFEIPAFTGNPRHSGAGGASLVTGDIVRLNVFQNSGAGLNVQARLMVVRASGPGS